MNELLLGLLCDGRWMWLGYSYLYRIDNVKCLIYGPAPITFPEENKLMWKRISQTKKIKMRKLEQTTEYLIPVKRYGRCLPYFFKLNTEHWMLDTILRICAKKGTLCTFQSSSFISFGSNLFSLLMSTSTSTLASHTHTQHTRNERKKKKNHNKWIETHFNSDCRLSHCLCIQKLK